MLLILTGDPQQKVLIERVVPIAVVFSVTQHSLGIGAHFAVRDALKVDTGKCVVGTDALCEDIAVEINLLQIGEDRLAVLGDRQRVAHTIDIVCRLCLVAQDQLGKIEESIVIDPSLPVFARQRDITELPFGFDPLFFKPVDLIGRAVQAQLFDIVIGIPDLMRDAQRDQHIGRKVAVHVRMQICTEFAV